MRGVRRSIGDHILDLQFLDGQQQSRLMRKIGAVARPVVGVIREAVAFPDPHRLLGQLFRRLQIVGIKLLRNDVIVRIQGRRLLPAFFGLVRVALVHDISGTKRCRRDHNHQHQLNLSLRF